MILVAAVLAGLAGGLIRAKTTKRSYQAKHLRFTWLVLLALIPQWLAFTFPPTRNALPDLLVSVTLVLSQAVLFIFAWINWKTPGFWLLAVGLVLNLVVIMANGGFMPISPDTTQWLAPNFPAETGEISQRFAKGKDIVLPIEKTALYFLSDRYRTPTLDLYRAAFSLGDCFIAAGAFWLFWAMGGKKSARLTQEIKNESYGGRIPSN